MNAVALPISVGPGAMPIPSSEGSLPEASMFGELVAAVAKGEGLPAEKTIDTAAEGNAALPDATPDMPPALVVRQWLAQTDSPPSLSKGLISVLERFNAGTQNGVGSESPSPPVSESEEPLPTDDRDIPAPEFAAPESPSLLVSESAQPLPTDDSEIPTPEFAAPAPPPPNQMGMESDKHPEKELEKTDIRVPDHDRSKPDHVVPRQGQGFSMLAPSVDPRVSIQHQNTGGIGWSALNAQMPNADGTLANGSVSVSSTRLDFSATARPAPETPFGARLESPKAPSGDSTKVAAESTADGVRAPAWDQPKTTHAAGNRNSPEHIAEPHLPARTPEQLPQPTGTTQASTNSPVHAPDAVSAPPPTTSPSPMRETSVDAPLKLALAVRGGQQTPEVQTLALHIAARSARGDSRFTIRLDPPELGRIDVNLAMNSHGHAHAVLAVEKPQTLDLLLRDAPALERALKDAGLELGSNLSFSLREEDRPHFAHDEHDTRPGHTVQLAPAEAMNTRSPLNSSIVEHWYGLRMARLDITV